MKISRKNYELFDEILSESVQNEYITDDQKNTLQATLEIRKLNSVFIILLFGFILISLGIVFVIASNWDALTLISKNIIVIVTFLVAYGLYIFFSRKDKNGFEPKLFFYLATVILLGGYIPILGEIYPNRSLEFWVLLTSIYLFVHNFFLEEKEVTIVSMIMGLIMIFMLIGRTNDLRSFGTVVSLAALGFILGTSFVNVEVKERGVIPFLFFPATVILAVIFLLELFFELDEFIVFFGVFAVSFAAYFIHFKHHLTRTSFKIVSGITALLLTGQNLWTYVTETYNVEASIIFAILVGIFYLIQIIKKDILSIIFLALIIGRYTLEYADQLTAAIVYIVLGLGVVGGVYLTRKVGERHEK